MTTFQTAVSEPPSLAPSGSQMRNRLMAPMDPAGLAIVRIGLGALIAWEVWREFDHRFLLVDYAEPVYLFRWWLFDWVRPLPDVWFYLPFMLLAAAALCVSLGLFYRPAAVVQFLGMSYWLLLEKARYLNHRYLACTFALLLIFVPAHAEYSVDARRLPWIRSRTVPAWTVWLMRFQVGVPHFFAGIAKLNFDWIVRAEPLKTWLAAQTDFPIIGRYFTSDVVVHFFAYGSAALDLALPVALLHRRSRAAAYGVALVFHFMNARLFNIGMFPWMMILATTVFFDGDWPRRFEATIRSGHRSARTLIGAGFIGGLIVGGFLPTSFSVVKALIGGFGVAFFAFQVLPDRLHTPPVSIESGRPTPWRRFHLTRRLVWALAVWVALQLLLPLRHFVVPGNAQWTEEGSRFAWHMLLHRKESRVVFHLTGPGAAEVGSVDLRDHLTDFQIGKMVQYPDLLLQFSHYLESYYRDLGVNGDIEIRVDSSVSLNSRPRQEMIDPAVDLTAVRRPYLPPAEWVVSLKPYG